MSKLSLAASIRALALATAMLALGSAGRAATPTLASFSGNNFEYPGFGTDGYKTWDVHGDQFTTTSADNAPVEIKGMKLHLYVGGPSLAVETVIESPQATVLKGQNEAHGPDALDIIGSNSTYLVHGFDWTWDGTSQVIQVRREVYVTFSAVATASAKPSAKPSQPVTINSHALEIHQNENGLNRFLFTGNVVVTDGDCYTTCDTLEVLADRSAAANPNVTNPPPVKNAGSAPAGLGLGRIERIVATHNVVTRQGDVEARSETAELSPGDQRVIMSGSPQVRTLSSDALVEGGRILWRRDSEEVDVDPILEGSNGAGRVRVTVPELESYQSTAEHPAASNSATKMVITGESLHGQLGATKRRFDIEKSVRVEDPSLNVTADHLDAEFDPPTSEPPAAPGLSAAAAVPQVGRLNHVMTNGSVKIEQFNRTTTTQQAEIFPAEGKILLAGAPHMVDSLSHATIDGKKIELSTDGRKALVTGEPGEPAKLVLASLPGLTDTFGSNVPTTVVGDSMTMLREEDNSNFTFQGRVHITARDLEATCGILDAYTHNSPVAPASTNAPAADMQLGEVQKLVARNFVEITQRRANASQSDYVAHAARAEIYPQAAMFDDASDTPDKAPPQRRFVELFGDPTGAEGPVRPEVEVPPMQDLNVTVDGPSPKPSTASGPTRITSDNQWLITGPTGSIYYFEDNVRIDGGSFQATCDRMRAEGSAPQNADSTKPAGPVVLERVIAESNVRITQGTQVSTAGKALILPHEQKVELSENATVVDSATGRRMENANIELSKGEVSATSASAVPEKPLTRLHFTLPPGTFDNVAKPANKASAGTSH